MKNIQAGGLSGLAGPAGLAGLAGGLGLGPQRLAVCERKRARVAVNGLRSDGRLKIFCNR